MFQQGLLHTYPLGFSLKKILSFHVFSFVFLLQKKTKYKKICKNTPHWFFITKEPNLVISFFFYKSKTNYNETSKSSKH